MLIRTLIFIYTLTHTFTIRIYFVYISVLLFFSTTSSDRFTRSYNRNVVPTRKQQQSYTRSCWSLSKYNHKTYCRFDRLSPTLSTHLYAWHRKKRDLPFKNINNKARKLIRSCIAEYSHIHMNCRRWVQC